MSNESKRWPPGAGIEATYITVDTSGPGELASLTLQAHGIPHTRLPPTFPREKEVEATTAPAMYPPGKGEGWSYAVWNGRDEHCAGFGCHSQEAMLEHLADTFPGFVESEAAKRIEAAAEKAVLAVEAAAAKVSEPAAPMSVNLCVDGDKLAQAVAKRQEPKVASPAVAWTGLVVLHPVTKTMMVFDATVEREGTTVIATITGHTKRMRCALGWAVEYRTDTLVHMGGSPHLGMVEKLVDSRDRSEVTVYVRLVPREG